MPDRNPFENHLLNQLDRARNRAPSIVKLRPSLSTDDPLHLVPRKPSPPFIPEQETTAMPTITAKSLKCTIVIDPAVLQTIHCPEGGSARTLVTVRTPDRTVVVDLASKAIRKGQGLIDTHGVDGCACIIQGKLVAGDKIAEAGLTVQPRAKPAVEKAEMAEAAA